MARKASSTRAGEREFIRFASEFLKPGSQDLRRFGPQRNGAFFAALAVQFQGGRRIENDFIAADLNDLGDARAGIVEGEK